MRLITATCALLMLSSTLALAGGDRKCMRDTGWFSAPMWKPIDRKAFWAPMDKRMAAWDAEWNRRWKR